MDKAIKMINDCLVNLPMKKSLLLITALAMAAAKGYSTDEKLSYTPEIRKGSAADDLLFHDLLSAPGGVGMMDEVFFPKATERKIVRIEVRAPYNNQQSGVERWTIEHAENDFVTYGVILTPDGSGGTNFAVKKDKESGSHAMDDSAERKSAFTFQNAEYFFRWANPDQEMFTPKGQGNFGMWTDMVVVGRYRTVQDQAALTAAAKTILGNFQKQRAYILGAHSIPGKDGQPTEYFMAVVYGQRDWLEVDFLRLTLADRVGRLLAYDHRIYGAKVGDQMSTWLKANGPSLEKDLLSWDTTQPLEFQPPSLSIP